MKIVLKTIAVGGVLSAVTASILLSGVPKQAKATDPAPVIGIQTAESKSSGCSQLLSSVQYSSDLTTYTMPPGNSDCARIYLQGAGPFNQDFQIGVRMMRKQDKQPTGWGPWGWSPWASDIAASGNGQWSPWIGALVNVGSDPGYAYYQVAINTRALPQGEIITNTQVGIQVGDNNNGSFPPYYCQQGPGEQDEQVYAYPGGWSGWSGATDVADCSRVYLSASLTRLDGSRVSDNIPTSFNLSETKNLGSDGNPLSISIQNTGSQAWLSDQVVNISQSGVCDVSDNGYTCPSLARAVGSSCTVVQSHGSSLISLQHIGGSFSAQPSGPTYDQQTTATCQLSANTPFCSGNSKPQCQNQGACGNGFCSRGGCDNQGDCGSPLKLGGCGGKWNDCSGGVWTEYSETTTGDPNVQPNATTQFPLTSLTSPNTQRTYSETWQLYSGDLPGNFGTAFQKSILVSGPPAPSGTINVWSKNFANGDAVTASWNMFGPTTFNSSNLTKDTYKSVPPGTWSGAPLTPSGQFALHGIENVSSLAVNGGGLWNGAEWLIGTARAYDRGCSAVNAMPTITYFSSNPCTGAMAQSIVSNGDVINFVILWDPVATISVDKTSWSPSGAGTSAATTQVTVSNGGASGSTLTGVAAAVTSAGTPWLTVTSPASCLNAGGVAVNGCSDTSGASTVTVTANPTGLLPGTYPGTIDFTSSGSQPNDKGGSSVITLNVNFNVGNAGAPTVTIVSPVPTAEGVNLKASCSGGTGSAYRWTSTGPANFKGTNGPNTTVSYSTQGTYQLTCTDSANNSGSASVTITPDCSISANPNAVSPSEQSTISWSCPSNTAVPDSCSIPNIRSGLPTTGSAAAFPSVDPTTYTLTCQANNGISNNDIPSSSTTVRVYGPLAITITSPTPTAAGVPLQASCSGGTGTYHWSSAGPATFSSITASNTTVSYSTPGTYQLTCTDSANKSAATNVTITPDCSFSANPTSVLPPQTTNLSWSCSPNTAVPNSCSISGVASGLPTAGSKAASPTVDPTTYVLSCQANNGIPGTNIPPSSIIVNVHGTGRIEINPS